MGDVSFIGLILYRISLIITIGAEDVKRVETIGLLPGLKYPHPASCRKARQAK